MSTPVRIPSSLPTWLTVIPLFLGALPWGAGCSCETSPGCFALQEGVAAWAEAGDPAAARCWQERETICENRGALSDTEVYLLTLDAEAGCGRPPERRMEDVRDAAAADAASADSDAARGDDASAEDPIPAGDGGRDASAATDAGTVALRVRAVGGGFVYVRPAGHEGEGISVYDMQTLTVSRGAPVTLDAFSGDARVRFVGWRGDVPGCTGSGPSLVLSPLVAGECVATFAPLASPCDGLTRLAPLFPEFYAVEPVTGAERGLIGTAGLRTGEDLRVTLMNADEFPEGRITIEASVSPDWRESRDGVDVVLPISLSGARACTVVTVRLAARDCGLASDLELPLRIEPRSGACP